MPRGAQVLRQWGLLKRLQQCRQGLPLAGLAAEFGVAERTIQRDLEELQTLGFPLKYQEAEFGRRLWSMPPNWLQAEPLVLTLTEAVSLYLVQRLVSPLAGTHFDEGLGSIIEKIRRQLPAKAIEHFADLDETIHVRWPARADYSGKTDIIAALEDAARQERTVEITYNGLWRRGQYETRCDPYGLVFYDGDLFVVGHSHRAQALRIFKVLRIVAVRSTSETFTRPEGFRMEDQFRSSFGIMQAVGEPVEVAVRFEPSIAGLIEERVWHESQRLIWEEPPETLFEADEPEGEKLLAVFRLADLVEFKRWILGFGNQVEVLRPESLRREIGEELLAAARRYGT